MLEEGKEVFILDKKGEDIRNIEMGKNLFFIMGGHDGIPKPELKRLKKWQLKIIEFLEMATPEKIHTTLEIEKGKLCPKCEGGLLIHEIRCEKDFKQFVFCDMMNQSIKVA